MSPPCHAFSSSTLSTQIQSDAKGKRRKLPPSVKDIDLTTCELLEMSQWKCNVEQPVTAESKIVCEEALRFFRRCADRKGTFLVETTSWEGRGFGGSESGKSVEANGDAKPFQWSSSWVEADSAGPS